MSEEAGVGAGLVVTEDKQMGDEREVTGIQNQSSPVGEQLTVIMTDEEFAREAMPDREVGKEESGLSEICSSPLGSFPVIT